jgi:hypothetical protein
METTLDDKQFLYIKVLRVLIRRGWRMYLATRRWQGRKPSGFVDFCKKKELCVNPTGVNEA